MTVQSQYKTILPCSFSSQMLLVDYYRSAPDLVQFNQYWCPDTTMMDKIKVGRFIDDLILQ